MQKSLSFKNSILGDDIENDHNRCLYQDDLFFKLVLEKKYGKNFSELFFKDLENPLLSLEPKLISSLSLSILLGAVHKRSIRFKSKLIFKIISDNKLELEKISNKNPNLIFEIVDSDHYQKKILPELELALELSNLNEEKFIEKLLTLRNETKELNLIISKKSNFSSYEALRKLAVSRLILGPYKNILFYDLDFKLKHLSLFFGANVFGFFSDTNELETKFSTHNLFTALEVLKKHPTFTMFETFSG